MRAPAVGIALLSVVAAGMVSLVPAAAATPADGTATLQWEMNEAPGATTMQDSGGQGVDGSIGSEVQTGEVYDGATGYRFPYLQPNQPPAHPEHLVSVPDNAALNPDSGNYSVEIRYRTTHAFGNLIQKGQSTTKGGQIKIQLPGGRPQCYFKGSGGKDGAGWRTPINDGQWHTLLCVRTPESVVLYVDGVQRGKKVGPTGVLSNTYPLTIGGKPYCDQVQVSCDYFSGQVDYVHITKG